MYATSQQLQDRFGAQMIRQIADRDGSGSADEALLVQVLRAASAEVDLALAGRYATPIDSANVPVIITELVMTLAFAKLFDAGTLPEDAENATKEARRTLKMLAEGKSP